MDLGGGFVAPMEYLVAWRMAIAKNLLRRNEGPIAEIAGRPL
jgi:hypothetical protein